MQEREPRAFYDDLAEDYHLVYPDWNASVRRQGTALDGVVRGALGDREHSVLDCSCGIGTQALGLARHGHRVVGSDLSPRAVRRAALEAAQRGLALPAAAADMRSLPFIDECFDVVVSGDNSVAHLLTDQDLRAALAGMRRVLRPGGLLVLTLRDYEHERAARRGAPRRFRR
jgi:SAM-dependent methyltransferase